MTILNPLHIAASALLFILAIPLTIFALITTIFAFSTLFLRVSIVYVELGGALLHSWLFVDSSSTTETLHHGPHPASPTTQSRLLRNRRASLPRPPPPSSSPHDATIAAAATAPSTSATIPAASTTASSDPVVRPHTQLRTKSGSSASLALFGSTGPTRDFEGVGGWRIAGSGEEEALWMGMNARLELPAVVGDHRGGGPQRRHHHHHHRRTSTGGSSASTGAVWLTRSSPEQTAIRISPMQGWARTPSVGEGGGGRGGGDGVGLGLGMSSSGSPEGYFNFKSVDEERRRRKGSGSSHSSAGGTPGTGLKRGFVD